MEDAIVTDIIEPPYKIGMVSDIIEVRLSGVALEQVSPVSMLCSYDLSIPKTNRIRCHLKIIPYKNKI